LIYPRTSFIQGDIAADLGRRLTQRILQEHQHEIERPNLSPVWLAPVVVAEAFEYVGCSCGRLTTVSRSNPGMINRVTHVAFYGCLDDPLPKIVLSVLDADLVPRDPGISGGAYFSS
jgi:hypothetical protein